MSKIAKSKVAQGLKSWADFGTQVTGGKKADKLAQITKHQVWEKDYKVLHAFFTASIAV